MAQILYVTEAEAAEKWCPKSISPVSGEYGDELHVVGANRDYGSRTQNTVSAAHCECLGSRCMWWVWVRSDDAYLGDRRQGFCGELMR